MVENSFESPNTIFYNDKHTATKSENLEISSGAAEAAAGSESNVVSWSHKGCSRAQNYMICFNVTKRL